MESGNSQSSDYIVPKSFLFKKGFMHLINRQSSANPDNFKSKLKSNLTKYIFNFFKYTEIYELGKVNIFFLNSLISYISSKNFWHEYLLSLKNNLNYQISENQLSETYEEAVKNKQKYKYVFKFRKNYLAFNLNNSVSYYSIANSFFWSHKNDTNNWEQREIKNSYENKLVPYLKSDNFINVNFSFFNVRKYNYNLFFNEHFDSHKNIFTIEIYINDEKIKEITYFPSKEIFEKNNSIDNKTNLELKEDFICRIDEKEFDKIPNNNLKNNLYEIAVKFKNDDITYQVKGWYIDGGHLLETE